MNDPEDPLAEALVNRPDDGKTKKIAGFTITETQLPLCIVFVASIVLLIATGAFYRWSFHGSYAGYAISIPSITLTLSFFALLMSKLSEETYAKAGQHVNMLCFIYAFVGACFLTFDKPFNQTSNGYFAAWAVVYGSGVAAGMMHSAFGFNSRGIGALMGLIVSSVVLMLACISPIKDNLHKDGAVFGITLSCVTFTLGVIFLYMDKKNPGAMPEFVFFGVLLVLAVSWIVMACITTFQGPFNATG